jgi:hemerythrin-like domain-containing protein
MIRGAVAGAVAAVTQKLPWTSDQLDALQLLERDHRRFEELLRQGEETTERAVKGRGELLETLTRELNEHELKEERFLYPLLQSHPEAKAIVLEGYQEHHVADVIVRELHEVAADDERWGAKFKVLKENIEHHIQEEERELFPAARRIFSREELRELAARMLALRPPPRPRARPRR